MHTFHSSVVSGDNPKTIFNEGVYNTSACNNNGIITLIINHGFCHGCTVNKELSNDTADNAFNISIITKTDNDKD
jgi:hypothetical protein